MADLKISQMTKATALAGGELIPIVQNGANKSTTVDLINKDMATQAWVQEQINETHKVIVVQTLPETGLLNRVYLIPNDATRPNDIYDEYIWLGPTDKWEFLGNKQVTIDLTPYYTKGEADDKFVQKEANKGLSTNDYTAADKTAVGTIVNKVDIVNGKQLSTNDFTDVLKTKLDNLPSDAYDKVEVDNKIDAIGEHTDAYTKVESDAKYATIVSTDTDLATKVDKVTGKDLSSNDFTDILKTKLDNHPDDIYSKVEVNDKIAAIGERTDAYTKSESDLKYATITSVDTKVDKEAGKGLSTNDFTDVLSTKLTGLNNYDDTAVNGKIDAEVSRAKAAETDLDTKITTKISKVELVQDAANQLHYTLLVDSVNKGEINIPKDQFLKSADYDSATKELVFVFVTSTGETTTKVSVTDLVDEYTAGNGLTLANNEFTIDIAVVATKADLAAKVDKVAGKGLSANDFTDTLKTKLDGLSNYDDTTIINTLDSKVDKVNGKQLSSNDFTNELKIKLEELTPYNSYVLVITNGIVDADAAQKVLDMYNNGGEIYVKYSSSEQLYKPSKIQVEGTIVTLFFSNYGESEGNSYTVISLTIGQTAIDTYGKKIVSITDTLTSQSASSALSANQGRILKEEIGTVRNGDVLPTGIYKIIEDNEEVVAESYNNLNARIVALESNSLEWGRY